MLDVHHAPEARNATLYFHPAIRGAPVLTEAHSLLDDAADHLTRGTRRALCAARDLADRVIRLLYRVAGNATRWPSAEFGPMHRRADAIRSEAFVRLRTGPGLRLTALRSCKRWQRAAMVANEVAFAG